MAIDGDLRDCGADWLQAMSALHARLSPLPIVMHLKPISRSWAAGRMSRPSKTVAGLSTVS